MCIPCISAYKNIENSEVNNHKYVYDHNAFNFMKYGIKFSSKLIDPSPR